MKNTLAFLLISIVAFSLTSCQTNINPLPTNTPTQEIKTNIIEKNIGDVLSLATMNFSIKKSEESNVLNSKYDAPTVARESTKFIILDVEVVNTTQNPFPHTDDGLVIIDDKNRKYNPYGTIGKIDNYLHMRELAPGIQESGKMVYEVPQDSTGHYFRILKGGSNEEFHIKL